MSALAAACCVAAGLLLGLPLGSRAGPRRLAGVDGRDSRTTSAYDRSGREEIHHLPGAGDPDLQTSGLAAGQPDRWELLLVGRPGRVLLGSLVGGVGWLMLGGRLGLLTGAVAAPAAYWVLRRLADRVTPRPDGEGDLPLALDLLAGCLDAGRPPDRAAAAVAAALPGVVGDSLGVVARSLRLGASPAQAWQRLTAVGIGEAALQSVIRCADSGAALAASLRAQAEDERSRRAVLARSAVRRAGVLVVLPLGLCFLPAFVCIGVVPLVLGVLGHVLHT